MQIELDRSSPVSLYRQISDAIRRSILLNQLPNGYRLPSERRMAAQLRVNRSTVVAAYQELCADGLVRGHVGRGTLIASDDGGRARPDARMQWCTMNREDVPPPDGGVRELYEYSQRDEVIQMSLGVPPPGLIPFELLGEIRARLVRERGATPFLPTPPCGLEALRELFAERLRSRGIPCGPAQVMIAGGAQHAIDLITRTFLEPDDLVCVEEPCYSGALHVLRSARVRLLAVPVDGEGLQTALLAAHLRRCQPKLILVQPTFHNPAGTVLSLSRRLELLELAQRHDVPVVELDPYSGLRYEGVDLPPLKALDQRHFVIHVDSLPRVLSEEVRLAAVVAPRDVVRKLAAAKSCLDLDASPLSEWILAELLRGGQYDAHIGAMRRAYAERRDILLEALRPAEALGLTWTVPRGGLHLWCRLPRGVQERTVRGSAHQRGVAYLPGASCSVTGESVDRIRLSFSRPAPEEIALGAERLIDAVRSAGASAGLRATVRCTGDLAPLRPRAGTRPGPQAEARRRAVRADARCR